MNRPPDRPARTQRHRIDSQEDLYNDQLPEHLAQETENPQPRRRRSQAARLRGDGEGDFSDTATPPSKEELAAYRTYGRPAVKRNSDGPVPALPMDDDPYYGEEQSPYAKGRRQKDDAYDDDRFADTLSKRPRRQTPVVQDDYDGDDEEYYDEYDEGDEPPRKKHIIRWAIIILIILAIVGGITYIGLQRPDIVEPVVQWGRELIGGATPTPVPTEEPTPPPTPSPEPVPLASAAKVISFSATPLEQPDLNEPVEFRVVTTMQTDRVQILDDNGVELIMGREGDYEDTEDGRIWRLKVIFLSPYFGRVEASPGNESGWNYENGGEVLIQVGDPNQQPTAAPDALTQGGDDQQGLANQVPTDEGGEDGNMQVADAGGVAPMMASADAALASADESTVTPVQLTGKAYNSTTLVDTFTRAKQVNFGDAVQYNGGTDGMNGVLTFRGSNMRQNAAYGYVAPVEMQFETVWSNFAGIATDADNDFGVQPLIVQWHSDIRKFMTMNPGMADKSRLKEVIFAGNDAVLHFIDLDDGTLSRDPITMEKGMPMVSTPAVYPFGYPLMVVGSGDPEDPVLEENDSGIVLYNMVINDYIGMLPGYNENAGSDVATVSTSPLIDNASDTMLQLTDNGMLVTMTLETTMDAQSQKLMDVNPGIQMYVAGDGSADMTVNGSLAAYGAYAYYATNGGIVQCVDINTFTPVWAINVGADTDATIAIDDSGSEVALYHASKADFSGMAHLRKINANTGEIIWDVVVPGSIAASPLVGTGALEDNVFFTARTSEAGGALYALDAATGTQLWTSDIASVTLSSISSSPVALYSEAGEAWILLGDESGLRLLEAQTGTEVASLALDAGVYGSPAAFEDMIVVATRDGKIHGIRLK